MSKKSKSAQRKIRKIREKVVGSGNRPRIVVFRSNKRIFTQAIDDTKGITIAAVTDFELDPKVTRVEKAKKVGQMLAEKLLKLGIKTAVFDRRQYKYHGRVKALAEGVREKGVVF